jgi:hypothetical protein
MPAPIQARRVRKHAAAQSHHTAGTSAPHLHVADAAGQAGTRRGWCRLGAERVDWDSYPADPDFIVLADPAGSRFCIVDLSDEHG